jgi:hypothetical protein
MFTGWIFGVSVVLFVLSLVGMPLLVVRMRADYFVARAPGSDSWSGRHPVVRIGVRVIKNVLGVVFLVAGFAMLVLPGQGVLTMLLGLTLVEFPGKRRLELAIIRQRPVHQAINWIRARARRPSLIVPDRGDDVP